VRTGCRCLLLLFTCALVGAAVHAQDFFWTAASARSNAMGGAYEASSTNVLDAMAANPAGLSELRGRNLNLGLGTIFSRGSFTNARNDSAPLETSPGVVPYGAFGMPIRHSRFSFGVSATPELLSEANWHYNDSPGLAGATYGYQQQKSAIDAIRFAAGLAYSFSPKFSLGATVGADYNTNTLQAPYIFQSQPALMGMKTLLDMHTTGIGWNASVGALAHPTRKLELGLAWKSRTVINSTGNASGDAYAQFAALGVSAPATFTYSSKVQNVLPQSLLASAGWQLSSKWLLAFQADWINWHEAFVTLPVTMTNGTNVVLNSLVGSNSFHDAVPLQWKDQYAFHGGIERSVTENTLIRAGFSHANDQVPDSTLTPLTTAILSNEITAGVASHHGRSRYEATYGFRPMASAHVDQSALLSGEYSNSSVHVATQSLMLNYSINF
jgi:long-chain fatty acid transport protein